MKKLLLLPALGLLFSLTPPLIRAEGDQPKPEKPQHEDTELEKSMDILGKAWRKLRKQADDPTKNASSLELMATIQAAAQENLKYTPDLAKDIPAEKRDKFIAGYQEKMKELIAAFEQLTAHFKANENPAAVALIAKIGTMQKEGHKEYKRPE